MANKKAKLQMEFGRTGTGAFEALTDSTDHTTFTSTADIWSGANGYAPEVRADGVATGGIITPGTANDTVDLAALTAWIGGAERSVSAAAAQAVPRPTTQPNRIHSLVSDVAGAVSVVSGTEGASPSAVRGAAGGPPWIPVGSIELGQVHQSSITSAVIAASEIKQLHGISCEKSDFPTYDDRSMMAQGGVTFHQALPLVHSDDSGSTSSAKGVYAKYYEPDFADVALASDYVPVQSQTTVNSDSTYDGPVGYTTESLQNGTLTAIVNNGITDPLVQADGDTRWLRFYPDKFQAPHRLDQGVIGIANNYPSEGNYSVAVTVSAVAKGLALAA